MRGQLSQVFLFLVAIIVIVATLFVGFRLFSALSGSACDAVQEDFEAAMRSAITDNIVRGSRNVVAIKPPCKAEMLCFVDGGAIGEAGFASSFATINASVHTGIATNLFLVSDDGVSPAGFDERIRLDVPLEHLCVEQGQGGFTFRTRGEGNTMLVRP